MTIDPADLYLGLVSNGWECIEAVSVPDGLAARKWRCTDCDATRKTADGRAPEKHDCGAQA